MDYMSIYEMLHSRTLEENREFYRINSIFLTLLTGISGFGLYLQSLQPMLLRLGFAIAIVWFFSDVGQVMWKRWWQGKHEKMEILLFNTPELKAIRQEGILHKPKLFGVPIRLTFIFLLLPVIFTFVSIQGLQLSFLFFMLPIIQLGMAFYASYMYAPFKV